MSKALVLGSKSIAGLICAALTQEEMEAAWTGPGLPSPNDVDGVERLRAFLSAKARPDFRFLHPGTTTWAERPELPTICQELGLTAIGPPARILSLFANKLNLLSEANQIGIPNLVLYFDPYCSIREIRARCPKFPFVLKSVRGDANLTIFVVHGEEDLEKRLPLWIEQLRRNLGQVILFPERYLESSRFVVVPFARLADGSVTTFPLIDTSIQSGFKKLIEFCPAAGIDPGVEGQMRKMTETFAHHVGYQGVGTLEFLVDGVAAHLLGGSPRLNTEFHLWEKVAGTSAVAWQLAALTGEEKADAPKITPSPDWASALAVRIWAEDPLLHLPQPGPVREIAPEREWNLPGPNQSAVRGELALEVEAGEEVVDDLIGSLWVGARDRAHAIRGAREILRRTWIAGSLQTSERFLFELLSHAFIREGVFHTGFVDEEFLPPIQPPAEMVPVFAAVCALAAVDTANPPNPPNPPNPADPPVRWSVGNRLSHPDRAVLDWIEGPTLWRTGPPNQEWTGISGVLRTERGPERVCAFPTRPGRWQTRIGLWVQSVRRLGPPGVRKLSALVPGQIHSILFREGKNVLAHEPLIIIESLRMLVPHALPRDARIARWLIEPEQKIQAGDDLAEIELL